MTPAAGDTRAELLVRRLVLLAGDVRDLLATGDWEGAAPVQDEYDEAFASLQRLVETGTQLTGARMANDLARLRHVHGENEALMLALQRTAGIELGRVSNVSRIGGYAPLGTNHRPTPRYVDGSA